MGLLSKCWPELTHLKADRWMHPLSRWLTLMDGLLVLGIIRRLQFLAIWELHRAALVSSHYITGLSPGQVIEKRTGGKPLFYDLVTKAIFFISVIPYLLHRLALFTEGETYIRAWIPRGKVRRSYLGGWLTPSTYHITVNHQITQCVHGGKGHKKFPWTERDLVLRTKCMMGTWSNIFELQSSHF